jgi:hypothetical protein
VESNSEGAKILYAACPLTGRAYILRAGCAALYLPTWPIYKNCQTTIDQFGKCVRRQNHIGPSPGGQDRLPLKLPSACALASRYSIASDCSVP